jgi:hypothetical protein
MAHLWMMLGLFSVEGKEDLKGGRLAATAVDGSSVDAVGAHGR